MNIYQLPAISNPGVYNACTGSLFYIDPEPSTNYCVNPSFEFDTNSWTGSTSVSITRVTDPYDGYWAAQVQFPTWSSTITYSSLIDVSTVYSCAFYMKTNTARLEKYTISLTTGGSTSTAQITVSPDWARYQVTLYTASPSGSIDFTITGVNPTTNPLYVDPRDFVIDAVQIEARETPTTYFDGDTLAFITATQTATPGYGWSGLQHASASYRTRGAANGGAIIDLQALGFEVLGLSGAGNPQIQNQITTYSNIDGGSLQNSIVGVRTLTIVGRISGSTKTVLHQNMQNIMQYFSRDTVAVDQPRRFIFQHTDGIDPIGQPLTFGGVIQSAITSDLTNALSVNVQIVIEMVDPYFYGHDASVQIPNENFYAFGQSGGGVIFDWQDMFTAQNSIDNPEVNFPTGDNRRFIANDLINVVHVAPDGRVYLGGIFTQITDTKTSTVYAHSYFTIYDPNLDSFVAPGSGFPNGAVYAIASTPKNEYVWVGGAFTTVGGTAANRIFVYDVASDTKFIPMGLNNTVRCIYVNPIMMPDVTYKYIVYVGGEFTQNSAATTNYRRIVKGPSITANAWIEVGQGVDNTVYSICVDHELDVGLFSGTFTAQTTGSATLFGIGIFDNVNEARNIVGNNGTISRFIFGLNGYANTINRFERGKAYIVGELGSFVNPVTGAGNPASYKDAGSILLCEYPEVTQIEPYDYQPQTYSFPPTTPLTPVPPTAKYSTLFRNGIVYATDSGAAPYYRLLCYYDLPSNIHQPLLPMDVGVFDTSGERIYFASNRLNAAQRYPKPVLHISNCTADARLRFRIYNYGSMNYQGNFLTGMGNFANSSYIVFNNMQNGAFPVIGTQIKAVPEGDVWDIDVDANIISSKYFGSLLNLIAPYSKLYEVTAQPGVNIIYVALYVEYVTTFEVTAGYTQRYQSLFDGINAQ